MNNMTAQDKNENGKNGLAVGLMGNRILELAESLYRKKKRNSLERFALESIVIFLFFFLCLLVRWNTWLILLFILLELYCAVETLFSHRGYLSVRKSYELIREYVPAGDFVVKRAQLLCEECGGINQSKFHTTGFPNHNHFWYYINDGNRRALNYGNYGNAEVYLSFLGSYEIFQDVESHGAAASTSMSDRCRMSKDDYVLIFVRNNPCMVFPGADINQLWEETLPN